MNSNPNARRTAGERSRVSLFDLADLTGRSYNDLETLRLNGDLKCRLIRGQWRCTLKTAMKFGLEPSPKPIQLSFEL